MSTENKNSGFSEENSDNSRNNNGTIGGAGGVEKEPKGSFHKMTERLKHEPANDRGIRENEEDHSLRALGGQQHGDGDYAPDEKDPNKHADQDREGKD